MKYRKKPIIIEAEQYFPKSSAAPPMGICRKPCLDGGLKKAHVHTIHNNQAVIVERGDWIIPEPDGVHFYPCKDEIFRATYEPVDK